MCSYTGLGLMSGSSLDGLDICCVEFTGDVSCDIWSHRVLAAVTVHYEDTWRQRLAGAQSLSGVELIRLHYDYAHFMGQAVQNFLADHRDCHVDFVAAHGHTIFHQPDHRLTFQLGDGETLATHLQCPLVTNFRAKDVALGGQGAPLVASGERFLYGGVGFCLNLGGIANISVRNGKAWDVCPFNIVFNELARRNNSSVQYDKDGELASKGVIQHDLLSSLESLNYYRLSAPKSLGIEWINTNLWPLLDEKMFSLADQARTYVEHVINRIADACEAHNSLNFNCQHSMSCIKRHGDCRILITGGGAHNTFFMCQLKERLQLMGLQLEDADTETVDFKEALVFAYLGLRCLLGAENVFADTTGARENSVAGSIHHPALISSVHKQFRFLLNRQASVP